MKYIVCSMNNGEIKEFFTKKQAEKYAEKYELENEKEIEKSNDIICIFPSQDK